MFDHKIRQHIDPPFERMAHYFFRNLNVTPIQLSLLGFLSGLLSFAFLYQQKYKIALSLILLNRLLDLFDGVLARLKTLKSDLGAFYDITFDFMIYAGVVLFMALGRGDTLSLQIGCYLLFCIMATGSAFLAFAIFAAKNQIECSAQQSGSKSLHFLGGLVEGTETFAFMVLICLFPKYFPLIGFVFGTMCLITALTRLITAYRILPR